MTLEHDLSGDLQTSTRMTCLALESLSWTLTTYFHSERSLRPALGDTNMVRTRHAGSTSGARFTRSLYFDWFIPETSSDWKHPPASVVFITESVTFKSFVIDEGGWQNGRLVTPVIVVILKLALMMLL